MTDEMPDYSFSFTSSKEETGEHVRWEGGFAGRAESDDDEITLSITPAVAKEIEKGRPARFEFDEGLDVHSVTIVIEEAE